MAVAEASTAEDACAELAAGAATAADSTATAATGTVDSADLTRVAILENEIGEVNIDSSYLTGLTPGRFALRELFSGCVCCTLSGELADAVKGLQDAIAPQWLIIETTGLAEPAKAAEKLRRTTSGLGRLLTIVLVDASRFLVLQKIGALVDQQVSGADVLLLNKADLVDAAALADLRARLHDLNPSAPVYETVATRGIGPELWRAALQVG